MKQRFLELLRKVDREDMDKLISWLEKSDFFTAPASTKFHGNYEGALVEHSLNVYELLNEKAKRFNLNVSEENIIIAALLHDVCKVNFYKKEVKWRKDKNDKWEQYEPYVIDDSMPLGHGEKSVMLLQAFIKLKREEIFMIRYHMGGFLGEEEKRNMYKAIDLVPSIVAIHTADFEASTFLEKTIEI